MMSTYSIEPIVTKIRKVATMNPQSPMRLVTKAFLPAVALASSVNQNEMRKYEQAPALPTEEGEQQVVAEHEHQHREGEQVQVEEELREFSSPCMYPIE